MFSSFIEDISNLKTGNAIEEDFCSVKMKVSDGKTIKVQIWNTLGQEKYESISNR